MDRSYPVTSHYQINRSATQSIHLCLPIVGERIKKNTCNISMGDLHIMVSYPVIKIIVYLNFFQPVLLTIKKVTQKIQKMNSRKTIWKTIHFNSKFWLNRGLYRPSFFNIFRGKVIFFQIIWKTFNETLRCNKSCKIWYFKKHSHDGSV